MTHVFGLSESEIRRIDEAFNEGAAAWARAVNGYIGSTGSLGQERSEVEVLAFVYGAVRASEPSPKSPPVSVGSNPWILWAVDRARKAGVLWSTIAFASGQFAAGDSPADVHRGTNREEKKQQARQAGPK